MGMPVPEPKDPDRPELNLMTMLRWMLIMAVLSGLGYVYWPALAAIAAAYAIKLWIWGK